MDNVHSASHKSFRIIYSQLIRENFIVDSDFQNAFKSVFDVASELLKLHSCRSKITELFNKRPELSGPSVNKVIYNTSGTSINLHNKIVDAINFN
jgi:hypothetical protein